MFGIDRHSGFFPSLRRNCRRWFGDIHPFEIVSLCLLGTVGGFSKWGNFYHGNSSAPVACLGFLLGDRRNCRWVSMDRRLDMSGRL